MAPKRAPGKNPAMMALVGNALQVVGSAATAVDVLVPVEVGEATGATTGVIVTELLSVADDGLVDEVVFEEVAVREVSLFKAQMLPAWHVYPSGQQALPHVERVAVRLVVLIGFLG